jgi:uncharacterized protein with NAD-binding domain and iron-sulfur cluster
VTAPRRIAILGGGQAALTAAFQLTDPANPAAQDLEVTIYQLGWRLGGKGATGRPTDAPWAAMRIQEHGLHNWFGFYDNSFAQMRRCYEQLERPAGAPMATFDEAFEPADEAVFVERLPTGPQLWTIRNMANTAKAGEGDLFDSPWDYVEEALEALLEKLLGTGLAAAGRGHPLLARTGHAAAHELLASAEDLARHLREHPDAPHPLAERLAAHAGEAPAWIRDLEGAALRAFAWVLWAFVAVLWETVKGPELLTPARNEERRLWIMANLAYAAIAGSIRDGVFAHGFDVLNDVELRAWLGANAYDDGGVMLASPVVEAIYTASFAYQRGDAAVAPGGSHPVAEDMEAGTALRGLVRSALTYKGAFAYRFRAGTADTCYAPVYEVLYRRGVRFAFFHRVTALEPGPAGIGRIRIARQAETIAEYAPLIDVGGLPCWPDAPRWELLRDGDWFRDHGVDFENPSPAARAREVERVLTAGEDYDAVVCALSLAALPAVAGEILERSPAWRAAVEHVKTVRTQALQLWLTESSAELGFPVAGHPITTWLFDRDSPLNVWGDFSELLPMEHWTGPVPASLSYFCSTMPDHGESPFDPFPDQAAADALVRADAVELIERGLAPVLPGLDPSQPAWRVLFDPRDPPGEGEARLDAQWVRANVTPTERYVLSVTGSSAHRLPVDDPELPNLYLAGDWTQCTLNCGCMEAATMSGMLCANALCGFPARDAIVGADF